MRIGIHPSDKPRWSEHDIRAGAWQAVCSGAAGVVYGHNNVWQMHHPEREKRESAHSAHLECCARSRELTPVDGRFKSACYPVPEVSWKAALSAPGPRSTRIVSEYLDALPAGVHDTKSPAQGRVVAIEAPNEVADRDGRVDVIASEGEGWLLAHSGHGYAFELDLTGFSGQARWLDPRSGEWNDADPVSGGNQRFVPPSNGGVEHDWVLEVKSG